MMDVEASESRWATTHPITITNDNNDNNDNDGISNANTISIRSIILLFVTIVLTLGVCMEGHCDGWISISYPSMPSFVTSGHGYEHSYYQDHDYQYGHGYEHEYSHSMQKIDIKDYAFLASDSEVDVDMGLGINDESGSWLQNSHDYEFRNDNKHDNDHDHVDPSEDQRRSSVLSSLSSQARTLQRRQLRGRQQVVYGSLSDVWLCLACAVGWTVWIISTLQEDPQTDPFREQNSKLVRGHVLQVTLGQDPDGTGIPVYHAVVDYIVETTEEPIQIRKTFETRQFVEEGFFNVELLVLEDDPTIAVLKADWLLESRQKQLQEPQQVWMRGCSIGVAFILVAISFWGAKNAVLRCRPRQQTYGWVSVGAGAFVLWPFSLFLYNIGGMCLRWVGPLAERQGTIIRAAARTNLQCGRVDQAVEPAGSLPMSARANSLVHNDSGISQSRGAYSASTVRIGGGVRNNIPTEAATTSSLRQSLASAFSSAHRHPHRAAAALQSTHTQQDIPSPSHLSINNTASSQPVFDEQRIFSLAQAQDYMSSGAWSPSQAGTSSNLDGGSRRMGGSSLAAHGDVPMDAPGDRYVPEYNIAVSRHSSVSSISSPAPEVSNNNLDSVVQRSILQMTNLVRTTPVNEVVAAAMPEAPLAGTVAAVVDEDSDVTHKQ